MKEFCISIWELSDKKDNERTKDLGEFKNNFTKDKD